MKGGYLQMGVETGRKKGTEAARPAATGEDIAAGHRDIPSRLVDGIRSIDIYNDIARVSFIRLDSQGIPLPAINLYIPLERVRDITEALSRLV